MHLPLSFFFSVYWRVSNVTATYVGTAADDEEEEDEGEESVSVDDVDGDTITYEEQDEGDQRQGNVTGLAQ